MYSDTMNPNDNNDDLNILAGKRVILAVSEPEEQEAFGQMLQSLDIDVLIADSASQTRQLLEDYPAQLLIMDINQPDMHGWQMISRIREINELRNLPITVITDQADVGVTVAEVDYLIRPVSIARLRQNVWNALKGSV